MGDSHDRDGITEMRPNEAQNAMAQKKTNTLSADLRTPRTLGVTPVDPVEQAGQLRGCQRHHSVLRRRPDKPTLLEPLGVERHANPVVPDELRPDLRQVL